MFWIPSQREAVYLGQASVTVECHSEAFPKSINYWVNSKGAMLQSSEWRHRSTAALQHCSTAAASPRLLQTTSTRS